MNKKDTVTPSPVIPDKGSNTEFREPTEVQKFLEIELSSANARIKELETKCQELQDWHDSHLT